MKARVPILSFIMILFLLSCGVPQADYDKLLEENKKLRRELDEYMNGADRLIGEIEQYYSDNNFEMVLKKIDYLLEKHPDYNNDPITLLREKAVINIENQKRKEEDKRKEQIRLLNINNTGMWEIRYFIDEFKEPTKEKYITNEKLITGTFSNSATTNSTLYVVFIITEDLRFQIKLFEYNSYNPVKTYGIDYYNVSILDGNKEKYSIKMVNYNDRLKCYSEKDNKVLHDIFLKGGTIKFKIIDSENSINEYFFTINNCEYYDNAYRMLLE